MAEVWVEFGRPFTLNLAGGKQLHFKQGQQRIDDALLNHWYVRANRTDVKPDEVLLGTQNFLKEDMEFARQIMQEEEESRARLQRLRDLRSKASAEQVRSTIAGMTVPNRNLTPEQQAMVDAAARQEAMQQAEKEKALNDSAAARANAAPMQEPVPVAAVNAAKGGVDPNLPLPPEPVTIASYKGRQELPPGVDNEPVGGNTPPSVHRPGRANTGVQTAPVKSSRPTLKRA